MRHVRLQLSFLVEILNSDILGDLISLARFVEMKAAPIKVGWIQDQVSHRRLPKYLQSLCHLLWHLFIYWTPLRQSEI